jgi:glycosyltransferase involved in cell wall biosynthesis
MNVPPKKDRIESDYLRREFGIAPDKKIIIYQGALINGRGIELVIEAVRNIDHAVLCILGTGPLQEKYREIIEEKSLLGKVILCGTVPYDKLHEITCSGDVGTAFFEPVSKSYELALPNKLFEYFAAGLPVLASDLPAIRDVYEKYEFGKILSTDATPGDIAEALKAILDNPEAYSETLKAASKKYNYDEEAKKLGGIFGY